jgi:hypothetical protein
MVGHYDQFDLRKIVGRAKFLHEIEVEHRMKDRDFVAYTNRKMTRFRLVMKIGRIMVYCVPEISDEDQFSLYLKINETIASLAGTDDLLVKVKKTARILLGEEVKA